MWLFLHKDTSLFDLFEDLDGWPLVGRAARVVGALAPSDELKATIPNNKAVVFVKPHAMLEGGGVQAMVRKKLQAEGISILSEGDISHTTIEEKRMIDIHYGAIAAKASLLTPKETNPSSNARELFGMTFGLSWADACESGQVLNAVDACKTLGINGDGMQSLWNEAQERKELIKFGGGFYCAKIA